MPDRVVFLKIGWMDDYAGHDEPADIRPKGGGRYNEENIGHEAFNFWPEGGRVYGYAHIDSNTYGLNLGRIDPAAAGASELPGVLVVWVAPKSGAGEPVVVGWYRNSTVLGVRANPPAGNSRDDFGYIAHASESEAVLVPSADRSVWAIPRRGYGGFGMANVLYTIDEEGEPRDDPWLVKLLDDIRSYQGPNAMPSPTPGGDEPPPGGSGPLPLRGRGTARGWPSR